MGIPHKHKQIYIVFKWASKIKSVFVCLDKGLGLAMSMQVEMFVYLDLFWVWPA
jgi:hypothetical protein